MRAIILAGGRGTRLQPYTAVFPKPLVPLGNTPVMEVLIRQLAAQGVDRVTMAIGHLGDLITAYFGDGHKFGLTIDYSRETESMGTAGPLGLIDDLEGDFLVMNGDVLTTLRFGQFMEYHRREGAPATIAMHTKTVQIQLGVIHLDGDNRVQDYIEKPCMHYLVSMGIYAFNESVLQYIPPKKHFDFPELILSLLHEHIPVLSYPSKDYWADIGTHDEYDKAAVEYEARKDDFLSPAPVGHGADTGVPVLQDV